MIKETNSFIFDKCVKLMFKLLLLAVFTIGVVGSFQSSDRSSIDRSSIDRSSFDRSFTEYDINGNCYYVDLSFPSGHRLVKTFRNCEGKDIVANTRDIILRLPIRTWYECPDTSTEVVVFAPNVNIIEVNASMYVYNASVSMGYATTLLLQSNATRNAFLNYSRCPNLKALFYDGDADSDAILTVDGLVYFTDIALLDWKYQVVSYWLACEAYNDPMLQSVTNAKPRRWAAGVNDLLIGPSDTAAAVAMKSALAGEHLDQSFLAAVASYDTSSDIWGFGGFGAA
jgi:hypothetical protein